MEIGPIVLGVLLPSLFTILLIWAKRAERQRDRTMEELRKIDEALFDD